MKYPSTILNLIECLKKFPSIGEKTAERLALSLLDMEDGVLDLFSKSLKDVKTHRGQDACLSSSRTQPHSPRRK